MPPPDPIDLVARALAADLHAEPDAVQEAQRPVPARIALAATNRTSRERLGFWLSSWGYVVRATALGAELIAMVAEGWPDLVILDTKLKEGRGFMIFPTLRERSPVPVVFWSSSRRPDDVARASALGAADFIGKRVTAPQVRDRIQVVLRQYHSQQLARPAGSESGRSAPAGSRATGSRVTGSWANESEGRGAEGGLGLGPRRPNTRWLGRPYRVGELTVEQVRPRATIGGRELALRPKEYRLLAALARRAGEFLSQQELVEEVWGSGQLSNLGIIHDPIKLLRQKLAVGARAASTGAPVISTQHGFGYRIAAPDVPVARASVGLDLTLVTRHPDE